MRPDDGAETPFVARRVLGPLAARVSAVGADAAAVLRALGPAAGRVEAVEPRAILQTEGERASRPRYVVSGWACRFMHFPDGRRQVFDVVLPGEGVGVCVRRRPLAFTSVAALTRVELVDAAGLFRPETLAQAPEVAPALEALADLDERRLLDQVARLGRMTALERLAHLLLQLHDRLAVIGAAANGRYAMPLTQEVLADLLGLSTVHVNRTVQELRRQGLVEMGRGALHLRDRLALERLLPTLPAPPARAIA